jgi:solute carrier family 35 (GDP-fucose transporter), member C1
MSSPTSLQEQKTKIVLVVLSYFFISITLVFVNKLLMDKNNSIDAPIFMTWYQCIITVAILYSLGEIGHSTTSSDSFFKQFPRFSYNIPTAQSLLPLSFIFVGMITFNNLCLKYVEVSFYNVARSLTIVFNVIFTYTMLHETTSTATIGCLLVVIVGFFLGSEGEVNFSLVGTFFGVVSSIFVSLNSIFTKKYMSVVDGNQWSLAAYSNMNAVLLFTPILIFSGELPILFASIVKLTSMYYWFLMTIGGVFGFLIGIVTIMQIKLTSPLTHNISGTAKACVQTVLALYIWRNPTTFNNLLGIALVLFGSSAYTYIRTREMEQSAALKKLSMESASKERNSGNANEESQKSEKV